MEKKRYTSEEKLTILREHLEKNVSISKLAERHKANPDAIYKWRRQFFENAYDYFDTKEKKVEEKKLKAAEERIKELESTLSVRESLISDLVADTFAMKKKLHGDNSIKNGSNRKSGTMW